MVDFQYKDSYGVKDLEEIVRLLRAPGGCPWDAEQTHQSIRRNFLEEAYEAVEAIDEGSPEHLKEELGDVLLQVVFHALMEQEAGRFDLDAVADGICKKLIFRHPHVFGEVSVSGTGEVLSNWEELKRKEKGQATNTDALEAVARYLDAVAARVILGTAAVTDPVFLRTALDRFGDRVAVGVDLKDGAIAIQGWRETAPEPAEAFFQRLVDWGVRTVICTDVSRDGMLGGTNVALYQSLAERLPLQLIASGGVSSLEELRRLKALGLYGAILGKALYTGALSLRDALGEVE